MYENFDYCIRALATDVGRKRAANEDNLGEAETVNGLVTVVCDGMGGHVGGAEASRIAVNAILQFLSQEYFDNPCDAITDAITVANMAILNRQAEEPSLKGMGSTCVMIIVRDGLVYYGWVGDSRIYLIRQNNITQLSKDESVVQALVDAGQITPAEAEHHSRKNEITNCLGIPTMTPPQVCRRPIQPQRGDTLLLCSDGLSGMIDNRSIAAIISDRARYRLPDRARRLIDAANAAGGLDNITALLLEFPSGTVTHNQPPATDNPPVPTPEPRTPRKIPLWAYIVGVLAVASTIAGIWFWCSRGSDKTGSDKEKESTEQVSTEGAEAIGKANTGAKEIMPITGVTANVSVTMPDSAETPLLVLVPTEDGTGCAVMTAALTGRELMTIKGTVTVDMLKLDTENYSVTTGKEGISIFAKDVAGNSFPRKFTVTIVQPGADKKKDGISVNIEVTATKLPN